MLSALFIYFVFLKLDQTGIYNGSIVPQLYTLLLFIYPSMSLEMFPDIYLIFHLFISNFLIEVYSLY